MLVLAQRRRAGAEARGAVAHRARMRAGGDLRRRGASVAISLASLTSRISSSSGDRSRCAGRRAARRCARARAARRASRRRAPAGRRARRTGTTPRLGRPAARGTIVVERARRGSASSTPSAAARPRGRGGSRPRSRARGPSSRHSSVLRPSASSSSQAPRLVEAGQVVEVAVVAIRVVAVAVALPLGRGRQHGDAAAGRASCSARRVRRRAQTSGLADAPRFMTRSATSPPWAPRAPARRHADAAARGGSRRRRPQGPAPPPARPRGRPARRA